jgi:hypothetical protein
MQIFVTGCWSRHELNDLAIAVGIGIAKTGDQYQVSAQVVLPSQIAGSKGGSPQAPVNLYKASGSTVYEALRKITTISPRKIYISHLRILVLGEDLAKEGISDVLDFFSRDTETRNDYFIVVAKDAKASDALKILTNLEKVPAVRLFTSLETSEKYWAPTSTVTLGTLITELPEITIEQHTVSKLGEVQCRNLNLTDPKTITELEQIADQEFIHLFEGTIKRVQQEYKSDIFGFGEVIHRSNPQAWKKLRDDWDQTFVHLPISIKPDSKISELGKVTNSFLEEMK